MEQLFTEEAKRMWEKQDKTWEAEKNARKKLMEDCLNTLGEQTKTKLKGDFLFYQLLSKNNKQYKLSSAKNFNSLK